MILYSKILQRISFNFLPFLPFFSIYGYKVSHLFRKSFVYSEKIHIFAAPNY